MRVSWFSQFLDIKQLKMWKIVLRKINLFSFNTTLLTSQTYRTLMPPIFLTKWTAHVTMRRSRGDFRSAVLRRCFRKSAKERDWHLLVSSLWNYWKCWKLFDHFSVFTQAIVELPGERKVTWKLLKITENSRLTGSSFWAVLFFTMLLALGLGSQIGMLEGMLCMIFDIDRFKRVRKPILTGFLCGFCFIIGLIFTTGEFKFENKAKTLPLSTIVKSKKWKCSKIISKR